MSFSRFALVFHCRQKNIRTKQSINSLCFPFHPVRWREELKRLILTHWCFWHEHWMQTWFRLEVHLVGVIQNSLETVPVLNCERSRQNHLWGHRWFPKHFLNTILIEQREYNYKSVQFPHFGTNKENTKIENIFALLNTMFKNSTTSYWHWEPLA